MKINVSKNSRELGEVAAELNSQIINNAIKTKGKARIVLSTGASQFDTLKSLVRQNVDWSKVDWSKVEMFHLDEYINLPESHPASFRKYLKERFIQLINLKKVYLVNGEVDVQQNIDYLSKEIQKEPIDLALIGIGENAHIAFNDPPADFETKAPYIIVDLDEECKQQQVGEGWFSSISEVPDQAISMSVYQILQSDVIVSCVPYEVKANAVKLILENKMTNNIPATILKTHPDFTLFLDKESASKVDESLLKNF
jgi:glucosamine-6-phosphate deaminase